MLYFCFLKRYQLCTDYYLFRFVASTYYREVVSTCDDSTLFASLAQGSAPQK
jgi:hypothetical protein